jgi:hypothetical protein
MNMFRFSCALLLVTATLSPGQPPINDVLKKIEENYSISSDFRASVTMTQQKPKQGAKVFDMVFYRRDKDEAFLIVFSAPEAEKGNVPAHQPRRIHRRLRCIRRRL